MAKIDNTKHLEDEPVLTFDTVLQTSKGQYSMTLAMNQAQLQYLVEVGFRTLIGMGALTLPPVTHIPEKDEADALHQSVMDDWKSKLN